MTAPSGAGRGPTRRDGEDVRVAALSGLFDYAGRFWPAELTLREALGEYERLRRGPDAWMTAAFVLVADELPGLAAEIRARRPADPVPVSVLLGSFDTARAALDTARAALDAAVTASRPGTGIVVEAVELRAAPHAGAALTDAIRDLVAALPAAGLPEVASVAVEIPVEPSGDGAPRTALAAVRAAGDPDGVRVLAKVRCGGRTAADFPSPAGLGAFLGTCVELDLPCKATAGLHHALPRTDRTGALMHGFLTLLAAGLLARSPDGPAADLDGVLTDGECGRTLLGTGSPSWRGRAPFGVGEVSAMRSRLLTRIGSCSVAEPVEDLTALDILPLRT